MLLSNMTTLESPSLLNCPCRRRWHREKERKRRQAAVPAAIGGAAAAAAGAAFLCYVTPAEHLRLPDVDDVREGIVAARIAAHAADLAKGIPGARDWDDAMARARHQLDWEEQFRLAIDPEKPRRYRASSRPDCDEACTMCGKMCAVRNMNKALKGETVDIMED